MIRTTIGIFEWVR